MFLIPGANRLLLFDNLLDLAGFPGNPVALILHCFQLAAHLIDALLDPLQPLAAQPDAQIFVTRMQMMNLFL